MAALAAVIGIIVLLGRVARRSGLVRFAQTRGFETSASRSPRLAIVDAIALDQRRRVHIVRCDGRECLVMTGAAGDLVLGWLEPTR